MKLSASIPNFKVSQHDGSTSPMQTLYRLTQYGQHPKETDIEEESPINSSMRVTSYKGIAPKFFGQENGTD